MTTTQPKRAAKKAATHQALVSAALVMFAERGFENVNAEEIAHEAGVSLRTFFRYFPTKESVLAFGEFHFFTALTEAYLRVPPDLAEWDAIARALRSSIPEITPHRRRARLHYEAVAPSPVLRGHQQIHHEASVDRLAEAVAQRRGRELPDAAAHLIALLTVTTLEHAIQEWAAGPAESDLAEMLAHRLDILGELAGADSATGDSAGLACLA